VRSAVDVLPSAAAAKRVFSRAGSLARSFYGSAHVTPMGQVAIGDDGRAFVTAGLDGKGRIAPARVVVWRAANVIGFVGVVGGNAAVAGDLARRQQARILRATGGVAIVVPRLQTGTVVSPPRGGAPTYRPLVLATAGARPVTIGRTAGPITLAPGRRGVSLAFRLAGDVPSRALLRLHVRIDIAGDAGAGNELDLVGAIDGTVFISSRLSAAFDPATGILHLAGDDVSETTARTIELTSTQIVHTGTLSTGTHRLQLRLEPALDGRLRALDAVILPDSAFVLR
jgi:hypothetical protein